MREYTRDAIVRQDKRYGEAVTRIAALEQEVSDHFSNHFWMRTEVIDLLPSDQSMINTL